VEGDLPTPSYTIDTIRWLQAGDAESVEYYFIIGIDAFADLMSWRSYEELLRRVTLLVAYREGFGGRPQLRQLADTLGYTIASSVWLGSDGRRNIHFLETLPPDVSSSDIRMHLETGEKVVPGLHRKVLAYIRENGLYLQFPENSEAEKE
jgi:nicotinate-nucleotide adenylyltransferase